MNVKFVTSKSNESAFRSDLAPFQTRVSGTVTVRAHAKDASCIWIEFESRRTQMIQDSFQRYLKMRESQKMLRSLSIYEVDQMGFATVNGVRQEVKA